MEALIEKLTTETQSLKAQYISMTEKWAVEDFNFTRNWVKDYHAGKFGFEEASKTYRRLPYHIINNNGTVTDHITKMVKSANAHYEQSILKLADRLTKKGLDANNLSVLTSHVGVNIEMTLTDGDKTVRAFTIIAEGAIQRPHYRYLIK